MARSSADARSRLKVTAAPTVHQSPSTRIRLSSGEALSQRMALASATSSGRCTMTSDAPATNSSASASPVSGSASRAANRAGMAAK